MKEFNVTVQQPAQIVGNFDEVRAGLENMMQAYVGLEVTEDNIPERKKDVATLRKMKTAIDDRRKAVKKEYEAPFKAFETKCKELTGIIDKQVDRINGELNVYEEKRKADKRLKIAQIYAQNIGEYVDFLPLARISDPKWENKSYSDNDIAAEIQTARLKVQQEVALIRKQCGEWAADCVEAYRLNGNDINAAFNRKNDLESARQRAEEEARKKAEEAALEKIKEVIPPIEDVKKMMENAPIMAATTPTIGYTFTVFNHDDYESVKAYMEMFEIEYMEGV